ncbi:hypothetical protein Y697_08400 [Mesotoga sp. BH458_6_3_2_1]|nr:hypothetical protein Y697_08400 [Mesotoga sp. BH458_6_3_2_1]
MARPVPLRGEAKNRVRKAGYQNGFLKRKKLRQVKTNLKAYSDDGGPLTDNDVLRVFSGSSFLSEKRLLVARYRADPPNRRILGQALRAGSSE